MKTLTICMDLWIGFLPCYPKSHEKPTKDWMLLQDQVIHIPPPIMIYVATMVVVDNMVMRMKRSILLRTMTTTVTDLHFLQLLDMTNLEDLISLRNPLGS